MSKIIIKNIGPLSYVELELNKVNVIMGPQSSGKSTIAKIISYCQWVEKRVILDGEYVYSFFEQFIKFHRVGENYFNSNSEIIYESNFVKISYKGLKHRQSIRKSKNLRYLKSKNIYIPAERNFVSVIPNLGKYKESNDNIMSFLYDWYETKKKYPKKRALEILNLGVNYFHLEENDSDILNIKGINKEIALKDASSGLQSVVPLAMLVDYLTEGFYKENTPTSVIETDEIKDIIAKNLYQVFKTDRVLELRDKMVNKDELSFSTREAERLVKLITSRAKYHYSNFIIEEPEQNLFPETQRDLIYFVLNKITRLGNHNLTLTTHSPYILYAINNCMLGNLVQKNMPAEVASELPSFNSWISPDLVSIWEIDKTDGTIKSIKDKDTGTVNRHYFNRVMNDVMDEYYEMLSYLEV